MVCLVRTFLDQNQLAQTLLRSGRPPMISDFRFESHIQFNKDSALPRPATEGPSGLQLPLSLPSELLNLQGVSETIEAMIKHFSALDLAWSLEVDGIYG